MPEKLEQHSTRFNKDEIEQLREMARQRKISVAALIRGFVLEGMRNESLHREVIEHEFEYLRREVILIKGLACAAIASSLQLGTQLLERNTDESDDMYVKRKKTFLDSSLQNAFRFGNQVYDIHEANRKGK